MNRGWPRRAGLLLHPTSLPGPQPRGDLGVEAHNFIDFLAAAGMGVWQMLPLGPTHEDLSPYQCTSVHAGDPQLISLRGLVDDGWLDAEDVGRPSTEALPVAHANFMDRADPETRQAFDTFRNTHAAWLPDFTLYQALREVQGGRSWVDWPPALRDRAPTALREARHELAGRIEGIAFEQFLFFRQWQALRDHAHAAGIRLFGDMPIFVAHDSAEVWAHREYFLLDDEGRPTVVAGVPPDYFSETGQRWGNPLYDWSRMQADGFAWWVERLRTQRELFDLIRVDHFRGFEACWEIPVEAETAIDGRWVQAPGRALFSRLREVFGELPLVAEDLGTITPEVEALRHEFGLPGMKILQFAFGGGADNPYLPHRHERMSVVYTGTHDNDTTLGWYLAAPPGLQDHVQGYLGYPGEAMPWPLIRAALASVAMLAVLPMQDVLALDSAHRMNRPGETEDNWRWRFDWGMVPGDLAERLHGLNALYGRL